MKTTIKTNTNKRSVYFMQATVKDDEGNYVPCIAVEGESGYYRTDWEWGPDWEEANEICDEMNERMGYTKLEALKIQLSTMGLGRERNV